MRPAPRVHVAHALERRLRLRAPALSGHRAACERVAEALAREPWGDRVSVRPLTGSVVIERGEGRIDAQAALARLAELVREERDESGHPIAEPRPGGHPGPTRIARAVAHAFAAINADVREALDDRADLGTIMPVVFAAAGVAEIGVTRKLPAPAWFNLLWWSLRSFMTFNQGALQEEEQRRAAAAPEGGSPGAGRGAR